MKTHEPVFRALRAQVQLELAEAATVVAEATRLAEQAARQVTTAKSRCESFTRALRDIMARPQLNAALVATMRRGQQLERAELRDGQTRLADAQQHEEHARTELAGVRNRERSVDRAIEAERRKQQLKLQALEMIRADEMWLQHSLRERP